jgi:hypothetical protein
MWNTFTEATVTIVLSIVGLAVVATLVSKNAQTGNIIRNAASGLGNDIAVAQSPVTGLSVQPNLSYANSLGMGFGS